VADITEDAREGDWWSVDLGHKKSSEDDLVEIRVGTSGKKSVNLDQYLEIRIVGFGLLPVVGGLLVLEIDTHDC